MDGITPPSSDGGNGVVISPHDMYAEIRATHDAVLAIATKLDTALTQGADHETRIRTIERRVWQLSGAGTTIGAAIGSILATLLHHGTSL